MPCRYCLTNTILFKTLNFNTMKKLLQTLFPFWFKATAPEPQAIRAAIIMGRLVVYYNNGTDRRFTGDGAHWNEYPDMRRCTAGECLELLNYSNYIRLHGHDWLAPGSEQTRESFKK